MFARDLAAAGSRNEAQVYSSTGFAGKTVGLIGEEG